jgi:phage tail-like protein
MAQAGTEARPQVVGGYRFLVEIDGMLVAGFAQVSGLQVETELEEITEGGLNDYAHRLPKRTKLQPLILKRGITISNVLWDWYAEVIEGTIKRKSGSVILFNEREQELRRWNFYDAFPYKWIGPELNANSSEVAVETIELVHNGLKPV